MAEDTDSSWWPDLTDSRTVRTIVFGVFALLTAAAVAASMYEIENRIPPRIYLFGFLGSTVYVFTSLASRFDEQDRYALKLACRAIAVFPLSAGVYLLAFAFPGGNGEVDMSTRFTSGLVFLAGAYVSVTLKALGGLARRMLGVTGGGPETSTESDSGGAADDPTA